MPASRAMIERLCAWFDSNARDLPWRASRMRTGYAALVAETMLQQTQVSRVVERFTQFMRVFPAIHRLAQADEQEVLRLWQGMGYYRRARNLHAAARMVVGDFAGRVPRDVEELMRLPGVGRYTAGAIASIVFGRAEPIVDGNVERVLSRVFAAGDSSGMNETDRRVWTWRKSSELVERASRPGVLNEALMELGATLCVPAPATPGCVACPIARWCDARRLGVQHQVPPPKARARTRAVHHHAVIVTRPRTGLLLLEQRPANAMWSGMWQTPTIEADAALDDAGIERSLSVRVSGLRKRGEFTHNTTHRRIRFHVYAATSRAVSGTWRAADDVGDLPMGNAQRRVLSYAGTASAG